MTETETIIEPADSQRYLACISGTVAAFDSRESGTLYHLFSREGTPFVNLEQMTDLIEQLLDGLQSPYPATQTRSFTRRARRPGRHRKEQIPVMKEQDLLKKHGDMGTYIIRVQQRQNSSWQGRITWVEQNKTANFRSVWEMIKLIEGSMDEAGHTDARPELSWDE